MITSDQAPQEVRCPTCGRVTPWNVWVVVNTQERPDLLGRIRDGTIRKLTCPGCGAEAWSALPLVVYNPTGFPRALIMSSEEDRPISARYASFLWFETGEVFHWMPHSIMLLVFRRDVRTDMDTITVRPGNDSPGGQEYYDFLQRLRVATRSNS
jgi:hypothetical protein